MSQKGLTEAIGLTQGRSAMLVVLVTLILTLAGATYLMYMSEADTGTLPLSVSNASGGPTDSDTETRLFIKLSILLVSVLLIMLFVIGSYLLIRVGRSVAGKPVGGSPTEYVDAWASYRITDEQIESATAETDDISGDDDSDSDDETTGSKDDG